MSTDEEEAPPPTPPPTNAAELEGEGPRGPRPAPPEVTELAEACVRFVHRAVGVTLDFTPETLSVLDHYVTSAALEAKGRPEALDLVARAVAAYFGEVIRRAYASWWHAGVDDIVSWQLRFEPVFLTLSPYALACSAMGLGEEVEGLGDAGLVIDEDEIDEIASHLAMLPPVPDDEFRLLTTRLDVIQIVVDQLKARAGKRGLGEVQFDDGDYD